MIPIIHEESHFLAVNKPAGLLTQAPEGIASVQDRIGDQIKVRDNHSGKPFIGLPHRLDRGTSGVLLLARNQRALKRFGEQFHSRKVGKFYIAVVRGACNFQLEAWEDWIRKVPDKPLAEIVDREEAGARHAKLDVRVAASEQGYSVLLFQLHTGRMHQIRVQAAARGLPLLGDLEYGGVEDSGFGAVNLEAKGEHPWNLFALHALRLEFRHPQTAKQLCLTASLPDAWLGLPQVIQASVAQLESASRQAIQDAWSNKLESIEYRSS